MRMIRGWMAILSLIGLADAASARDLVGRFGYLGEWDVTARLTEEKAAPSSAPAFAGSLSMKHNAVCGPGETPEKSGHIRMSVRGTRYTAQMTLAGTSCDFSGTLSESAHVFVTCGGEGGIPLRIWFK
ncbi:hypothetical protein [Bosea sp. (in: a-proteobacteria)]|jgi:hypothetical protein|uniref:hypothetical protein n=1 Tax=Bosea sp. (in: a-proteobacteria) TaxID=1871050 RepID=UPI00356743D2